VHTALPSKDLNGRQPGLEGDRRPELRPRPCESTLLGLVGDTQTLRRLRRVETGGSVPNHFSLANRQSKNRLPKRLGKDPSGGHVFR
jgi:hypothetical protein